MAIITEQYLRQYFKKHADVEGYFANEDDKFTPSAIDYLNLKNIEVIRTKDNFLKNDDVKNERYSKPLDSGDWQTPDSYKILHTGEIVDKKPETMTHLYENILVYKDDPRIILRGKLDTLQSKIIEIQAVIAYYQSSEQLVKDLTEILNYTRKILGYEVLNKQLPDDLTLLGFTEKQIRDISHNPLKYFNLKQMVLIEHTDGIVVTKLNLLRALVREVELQAVITFRKNDTFERYDIVQALNRLSSIFHILMYRELAGGFKTQF